MTPRTSTLGFVAFVFLLASCASRPSQSAPARYSGDAPPSPPRAIDEEAAETTTAPRGTWVEPEPPSYGRTERWRTTLEDYVTQSAELEVQMSQALQLGAPNCPRAEQFRDTICQLAEAICEIADEHPESEDARERCEDGERRCENAHRRVAVACI